MFFFITFVFISFLAQKTRSFSPLFGTNHKLNIVSSPTSILHPIHRRNKSILHGHTFTNIETASASIAGQDPDSPGKINQDVSFHFTTSDMRYICGGVLDGHGKKGHVLNQYLIIHLPQLLQKYLENEIVIIADTDTIPKMLVKTFEEAHYAARIDEAVPAARSGTTCVVTVVDVKTGMLYTSNVGDSTAIFKSTQCQLRRGMP